MQYNINKSVIQSKVIYVVHYNYIKDKLKGLNLWQDELFKQLSPGFKELLK